jgi:hypothetical protein
MVLDACAKPRLNGPNQKENAMNDKKTNNRTETNAADSYQGKANDIARLIDVLQMELEKHASAAVADAKNWGRVGDLGEVRRRLMETVSFLSGMEIQNIETFLAE